MQPLKLDRPTGVFAAVLTPFDHTGAVDSAMLALHCRWLLANGCDGLSILGTTGEGNSLSVDERIALLERLVSDGIPAQVLLPGTGCCAVPDTVRLTDRAVQLGVAGVLMLPPFYYKAVDDEGLYASFASVIDGVGDARLRVYLYHIPPVSQIAISLALIGMLLKTYDKAVVGLKDSSGDWSTTLSILNEYPTLETLRHGGAGTITASANVNPAGIRRLYEQWKEPQADRTQAHITQLRSTIQRRGTIPALKAIAAAYYAHEGWRTVRPPLRSLPRAAAAELASELGEQGFTMGQAA
jgi:4-hydroxy-tetrahydrodipicolinate synthase